MFPRQEKGINKRPESKKSEELLIFSVQTVISSIICFPTLIVETVKKQVDFFDKKDNSSLFAVHYFSRKKWQLWEISESLQLLKKRIVRNIPGVTWHRTQMFPDHKRITSLKFLRKLRVE